jgi:hypothetical protein
MYQLGNRARWGVGILGSALLALAAVWLGYRSSESLIARDYEECTELAQADSSSAVQSSQSISHCGERFAGRRKAGGGYAYFDFMQNRTFDIAGPNPNEEERKKIDRSYVKFLAAQGREIFLSDLAKAQANQEQAAFERGRQDVGPPLALTPKVPLPVRRPALEHVRSCEGGSLSCSWAKLSAAVKNAFASSVNTNR